MFIKSELDKIIHIEETVYKYFDSMKISIDKFYKNNDMNLLRYEEPVNLRYGFIDIETGKSFVMNLAYALGGLRNFNEYVENYYYVALYNKSIINFIRNHPNSVCWDDVSSRYNLSKEFIREFCNKIDFEELMHNNKISYEIKDFCRMFL